MHLVFDTNVFLQDGPHLAKLSSFFVCEPKKSFIRIQFDDKGKLINEFFKNKTDRNELGEKLFQQLLEKSDLFVDYISLANNDDESNDIFEYLTKIGCGEIELLLFKLASKCEGVVISPIIWNNLSIPRRYLTKSSFEDLRNKIPLVILSDLLELFIAPKDISELEILLKNPNKNYENQCLEFKCPEKPEDGLKKDLLKEIITEICGFLNTKGGFLYIGITDKTREITPFSLKYDKKPKTIEQLVSTIKDNISQIKYLDYLKDKTTFNKLNYNQLISINPIVSVDKGETKCIISIYTRKGNSDNSDKHYLYKHKDIGKGKLTKYIREESETKIDKTFHDNHQELLDK